MSKEEKPRKVRRHERFYTRAKSEKMLTSGADPTETFRDDKGTTKGRYTDHPNPHVRRRAWQLMGRPLPENPDEQNKFLATLQGTPVPKDPAVAVGFYQLIRQRILKEVPVKAPIEELAEVPPEVPAEPIAEEAAQSS